MFEKRHLNKVMFTVLCFMHGASHLPGGGGATMMWMMILYLHINEKHDDDDDDIS